MASVNKVILVGNLGRDPEIRSFQNGGRVATLSVATSEHWKDKASGERREKTEWHQVVIFTEGLVVTAEKYLRKGSKLYVEGQLRTRKWQDNSGADRWSTEVVLQGFNASLVLLDKREGEAGRHDYSGYSDDRPAPGGSGSSGGASRGGSAFDADLDDDVPF